jgi:hypothetical protein
MQGGVTLALVSTFAGNLLLVGSIANLIVVDLAEKSGMCHRLARASAHRCTDHPDVTWHRRHLAALTALPRAAPGRPQWVVWRPDCAR